MMNEHEVLRLTREALDLLTTAVHFDKSNSLVGACDFYDLAILNIDEVLNKLTPYSPIWNSLMARRTMYDSRLEYLRDLENSKFDFSNISLGLESESDISKSPTRASRKRRQSHVAFEDLHIESPNIINDNNIEVKKTISYESPPSSTIKTSYWQLRIIANTIDDGGYLTPNLYVPKNLWTQYGVKFSGLSAKTAAFQTIISNLNSHLCILDLPLGNEDTINDENTQLNLLQNLRNAHAALKSILEEFNNLQNQLSKPFPFIRETVKEKDDIVINSSLQKGQVSRITNMVSALSKNVRKYAEVGYQRLGTIPVRLSEEDFTAFTTLTSHLCDRCQLFDKWNDSIESLRELTIRKLDRDNEGQIQTALVSAIENCLGELHKISLFFRDVVCEMLLRDIETLLTRYLSKMRKSFSRMYWDDDLD